MGIVGKHKNMKGEVFIEEDKERKKNWFGALTFVGKVKKPKTSYLWNWEVGGVLTSWTHRWLLGIYIRDLAKHYFLVVDEKLKCNSYKMWVWMNGQLFKYFILRIFRRFQKLVRFENCFDFTNVFATVWILWPNVT